MIEAIVAIAIFLFVIGAVITVFISFLESQRNIFQDQKMLNQISYVQEHISKGLRMAKTDSDGSCMSQAGYIYQLTRHNLTEGIPQGIKFINQSDGDACQEFFLDGSVLKELKNSTDDLDALPLVSEDVKILSIRFAINGVKVADDSIQGALENESLQPRVSVILEIEDPEGGESTVMETTVSQRNLNVQEVIP